MDEIRFKQPRVTPNNEFIDWFHWGFIGGGFTAPLRHDLPSYQYIGLNDCANKDIYEGDRVLYAGLAGTVIYDRANCTFKVKSDGRQRVKYQPLSKTCQAQITVIGSTLHAMSTGTGSIYCFTGKIR